MSYIEGVVYDPPSSDYPPLIVIFKPNGEVLAVRATPTLEAGKDFLTRVEEGVRTGLDVERTRKNANGKQ